MTDIGMDEEIVVDNPPAYPHKVVLYKKWFKTASRGGFVSIKDALAITKVQIDIGEIDGSSALVNSTDVFVDAIVLSTYLKAVVEGYAETLYPSNSKLGVPTNEGIAFYGGSSSSGKPVSRIFKAHWWPNGKENYDSTSFIWKCGHFEAKPSSTGAFVPDMSKMISASSIKMSRQELAEVETRLRLALIGHTVNNFAWLDNDPQN